MKEELIRRLKLGEIAEKDFRNKLNSYSSEDIEDVFNNYRNYGLDFYGNNLELLVTHLTEKKGSYETEEEGKKHLGWRLAKGRLNINGNAGDDAGHSMSGGRIFIRKNAGNLTGEGMSGGKIYIQGNALDLTGSVMSGGIILCLGKIKGVSQFIKGGHIFASEFEKVPESVEKFVCDFKTLLSDKKISDYIGKGFGSLLEEYENLPEVFQRKIDEVIAKRPEIFYPFANNKSRQKLISGLIKIDETEAALRHEATRGEMW